MTVQPRDRGMVYNIQRFSIHDGHPTFENVYTDPVDANEFAANLVKPVFREGWKLPDMPK